MKEPDLIVYSDYVCPFCFLADVALNPLRAEGCVIEFRPYELRPAPAPLPDMRSGAYRAGWTQSVEPLARALGVSGMTFPERSTRTRKAHEAAQFALRAGAGDAMHEALFRAWFVDGRDIGRVDVLCDLAAGLGLDRAALKVELDVDKYTDDVVAFEAEAAQIGITGVPGYVVPRLRQMTMGVRDADALRGWLASEPKRNEDG